MVAPVFKQTWVASAVLVNMFGIGILLSYPSSLLPGLKDPDSDIKTDSETASWLASSIALSTVIGFTSSSFLMEWRGRRFAKIVEILPSIIGWAVIYFATNVSTIMAGRILGGITAGGTVTLGAIALGEYTSPKSRGTFLGLKTTAVCLGTTATHIFARYYHWRTVAAIAFFPQMLAFLMVFTWPESPSWLVSKGQFEKSEEVFFWLRGKNEESEQEISEMVQAQKERMLRITESQNIRERLKDFFLKFIKKDFIIPTIISFFAAVVLEASGRHYFPAYAIDIIDSFTENKTESFYYTLGIDVITIFSATFSSFLVKVIKRRTLLFSTGFTSLLVLICICVYLFLSDKSIIPKNHPWIPPTMLIAFLLLANLGCTPIPLAILGEIFPLPHRSAGTIVSGFSLSITLLAALKITPTLIASLQIYGAFAVLGTCLGVSLVVLYVTLPETKDRTLQEIEDYFKHGKYKD